MTSQLDREVEKSPRVTGQFTYGAAKNKTPSWNAPNNWRVTLRHEGRTLSVDFYGGEAVTNPSVADVLSSLMLDASLGEQSFSDFCGDFGYDEDSRSAYATWEACRKAAGGVKRLLGASWDRFADCEH